MINQARGETFLLTLVTQSMVDHEQGETLTLTLAPQSTADPDQDSAFTLTMATPIVTDPASTSNYNYLSNKPSINNVILIGNVSLEALGIQPAGDYASEEITAGEVDELIDALV